MCFMVIFIVYKFYILHFVEANLCQRTETNFVTYVDADRRTDRRIRVTRCVPSAGAYKYPSRNNVDLYKLYLVKSSFVVFGGKKMAQLYHPDRPQSQD